ncbi:MAG: Nitric oxide reductase FlRd-NAD(+) reductase [Myxococcota bacterium]|nr:Nitric oxide reductase FlRd-NAD(+) reductase [Myxococcota bacterium]
MKVLIIGNGVAGVTCALHLRQLDAKADIAIVSGETPHFFSRTALMYAYMNHMNRRDLEPYERGVWKQQRIELIQAWVKELKPGAAIRDDGREIPWDRLVIASGSTPNRFAWKGIDKVQDGLVNFVSMQDLDACERLTPSTRRAAVVGGGLIGVELVECLRHFGREVVFLVREPWYWPAALGAEEAAFVTEHLRAHGVDVHLGEELDEILTDSAGRVRGLRVKSGGEISCEMLGVCAGVRPAADWLKQTTLGVACGRGVIVNDRFETNIPQVWACGDVAEIHRPGQPPLIEQIWYSAKRQGAAAARNVAGIPANYEPPLFFNSSKFFDIEYTTVGDVMRLPAGTPTIYRRLPDRPVSQRIAHDGGRVLGFNMLGSRWNHEILERWILERRSPEFVLEHLEAAQFDVEFGRAPLRRMTGESLPLKKAGAP